MTSFARLVSTDTPRSVVLIRIAVGTVFFFEGIQKFTYPAQLGARRFDGRCSSDRSSSSSWAQDNGRLIIDSWTRSLDESDLQSPLKTKPKVTLCAQNSHRIAQN